MRADADPADTDRPLRIAYLLPGTPVSGGIAIVCQHANRLHARGHDVLLVSETPQRSIDWFPGQAVPVVGRVDIPTDLDCLIATGWTTSFAAAVLPARHKFYFVQSDETRFHAQGSPWQHITRLSYMLDLDFLTEARWIRSWLAESFQKDAELVPNGLDETIFFPSEPLEPRGRRVRVVLEGAIDLPYKGMAEAYAAVADEDVDIWVVSSLGRPPKHWRVDRFFERVPMAEMRHIYSSCDILLKLSRVEGLFGPPMEMMACGGAVVVGRVTGHDEYIQDGVNALVVDAERPAEARAAVRRLIDDPALRRSIVEGGRRTAAQWRWEPSIDILERYLRDVVAGRRGIRQSPATRQRSLSIAYFYGMLRGETWRDTGAAVAWVSPAAPKGRTSSMSDDEPQAVGTASVPGNVVITVDPTEKLITRLRQAGWFRACSWLAYRAHRLALTIREAAR